MQDYLSFPRGLRLSLAWRGANITHVLPADAAFRGYHFMAWEFDQVDPFFLYSPTDELVARWETPPSLGSVADAIQ